MPALLAHADSPETHVAAVAIALAALAVGFVVGRALGRREGTVKTSAADKPREP